MTDERLLIVGTLGGGGIHRYVEEQRSHLSDHFDVSVYDMYSEQHGKDLLGILRTLVLSLVAALRFPFRSRPDIVHVHTSHYFSFLRSSFYVLFAALVWRSPVVLHIHGSSFDEFVDDGSWLLEQIRTLIFALTNSVVVLSPYWQETLTGTVARERLDVLPNAVEADEYDPTFDVTSPHVVFLSNLVERKGIQTFVEAIDELQDRSDREFRVSIAGDGPFADEARALASRWDDVSYLGYVSEADKRALLESASIYVLPTHAEGLPIAMLEAMAGGNAIVSTTVGSIPEVIGPENGALIEPRDTGRLTGVLESMVDDPGTVERMGRRNRRLVEEHYAWDAAVEKLLSIYDDLRAPRVGRRRTPDAPRRSGGERVEE